MRRLRSTASALTLLLGLGAVVPGQAEPPAAPTAARPATPTGRIFADAFLVWIYSRPERDLAPIGYLRAGQSAELRAEAPVSRRGCGGGWYEVAPEGYVCLDRLASLSATRYSQSMGQLMPKGGPHPFDYVLSMGAPAYRRVPTPAEWLKKERKFGDAKPRPLPPHWRGHEELVTGEHLSPQPKPSFAEGGGSVSREQEPRLVRREVPFGSMLAVTGSFEADGRNFYVSADGTFVPSDRMRLFQRSTFEGVPLGESGSPKLPLSWARKKTRHYRLLDSAACSIFGSAARVEPNEKPGKIGTRPAQLKKECLVPLEVWSSERELHPLSGRTVDVAGTRFVETKAGDLIPLRFLYLAEAHAPPSSRVEKWIHFTIGEGTLVTYQGESAMFATLASPGIGGTPKIGGDSLSDRTTPIGTYRIQFKHVTDDMSPESGEHRSFWIADVPYAMYFKQPFAIHVAYWHQSFGEPMSGGCINVSPRDGRRLFEFADPPLPEGWAGVGAGREFGLGTTVVIER